MKRFVSKPPVGRFHCTEAGKIAPPHLQAAGGHKRTKREKARTNRHMSVTNRHGRRPKRQHFRRPVGTGGPQQWRGATPSLSGSPALSRGCQPGPRGADSTMPRPPPRGPGRLSPCVHPRVHRLGNRGFPRQIPPSAPDCKSAIVGSTPTGASASETPAICRQQRPSQGFFCFLARRWRIVRRWILRGRASRIFWAKYLRHSIVVVCVDGGGAQTGFAAFSPAT